MCIAMVKYFYLLLLVQMYDIETESFVELASRIADDGYWIPAMMVDREAFPAC